MHYSQFHAHDIELVKVRMPITAVLGHREQGNERREMLRLAGRVHLEDFNEMRVEARETRGALAAMALMQARPE